VEELSLGRACFVKLMVAGADEVDILFFGDLVGELSTGL